MKYRKPSICDRFNLTRFNCFAKNCPFKGGGAIDFFDRLNDLSAKEASHILACAYGIQPYQTEELPEVKGAKSETEMQTFKKNGSSNGAKPEQIKESEYVTRKEFADLNDKLIRMRNILFGHMIECDQPCDIADEYDPPLTKHHLIV